MSSTVRTIRLKRIRIGALAPLVFSGVGMIMIPMSLFFGVLALFGANTVHLNGNNVVGIGGLVLAMVYGPVFTAVFGLLAWPAAYLGIALAGCIRPLTIEYVPAAGENPASGIAQAPPVLTPPVLPGPSSGAALR